MAESPLPEFAFAHYQVRRREDGAYCELGRGAMGVTYKAYDPRLRVEVALKVINPAQLGDAKARSLFLREARAAARVHQSNVASVVYLNEDAANPFYAMEFVDGQSLRDWLHPRAPVEPLMAVGLALQVARGLEAIHREEVIHRDLKPANLMVLRADAKRAESDPEAWQIKIIDFGLAKRLSMDATESTAGAEMGTLGFRGTALYASPEQCEERRDLDCRSDLYSLGCVIWEMVVGAPPFRASVYRELLNAHVAKAPPLQQLSHLPACLQEIIARLLSKDRDARFADAGALIKALENCRGQIERGEAGGENAPTTHLPATDSARVSAGSATGRTLVAAEFGGRRGLVIGALALLALGGIIFGILSKVSRNQSPSTSGSAAAVTPSPSSSTVVPPIADTSSPKAVTPVRGTPPEKSIAVLPFENRSSDKENAYFADGVQDEILTDLARIADLKVISRTSVMQYGSGVKRNLRDIASELGVTFVLEGSVQRAGGKVRITAQLIDARTDGHVWAEHYDRELADVFAIQSEIASTIAIQLKARLTPAERAAIAEPVTTDLAAYDLYLRAKQMAHSAPAGAAADDLRSLKLLREAIARAPDFFLAYCFAARQLDNLAFSVQGEEGQQFGREAEAMVNEVVRLQPDAGETLLAQAHHYYFVYDDRKKAGEFLSRALAKLPNDAEGWALLGLIDRAEGRWEESLRDMRRAVALDPTNISTLQYLTTTPLLMRRFSECASTLDRMVALSAPPRRWELELRRAQLTAYEFGDILPLRQVRDRILREDSTAEVRPYLEGMWWYIAEVERDSAAMARVLVQDANQADRRERIWWTQKRVLFDILREDRKAIGPACEKLVPELAADIAKRVGPARNADDIESLGWFYAALGRRDDAIRLGLQARELNSLRRHAVRGTSALINLAEIYSLLGESDLAIDQLELVASIPSQINYGELKLGLIWDPLRSNPRFTSLLEKLKPMEVTP